VDNGSPVTDFKVFVRQSDASTFTQVACTVVDRTCTITLLELRTAPFSLVKDDSVVAQVVSTNLYGDSEVSSPGNGAVI
jgi:hypothetical protein